MKLMFFITGIGYGDAIREYSIIKELSKKTDMEILIVAYNNSHRYFKDKFNTVKIIGYNISDTNFEFKALNFIKQNVLLPMLFPINLLKLIIITKKFNPDLIITDFEPIGVIIARLMEKKLIITFGVEPSTLKKIETKSPFEFLQKKYLELMYSFSNYASATIIPSLTGEKQKEEKFYFINPIIRKQPKELSGTKNLIKKLKLDRKPILIMLGGSHFGFSIAHEMMNILDTIDEDFIIFGYDYLYTKKNIKCLPFRENFLEYLKVCKGVITLAGHSTISEALIYKKPCLVFPIKNHLEQEINARILEKNNLAIVKHLKEIDQHLIKKYILAFIKEIPHLQKHLNDFNLTGDGAKDAAEIILKTLKK